MKAPEVIGYLPGAFDMFSAQDLADLRRARSECDYLMVGVWGDDVVLTRSGQKPVIPFAERLEIARSMEPVDAAIGQLTVSSEPVWQQVRFHKIFLGSADRGDGIEWLAMGVDAVDIRPGPHMLLH